jgi:hypothetical protein
LQGSGLYWQLFPAGQSGNALIRSVKNARLFIVIIILVGKPLKRGHAVRTLIAGSVKFILLSKGTLI